MYLIRLFRSKKVDNGALGPCEFPRSTSPRIGGTDAQGTETVRLPSTLTRHNHGIVPRFS
jgi:hypothetical protein